MAISIYSDIVIERFCYITNLYYKNFWAFQGEYSKRGIYLSRYIPPEGYTLLSVYCRRGIPC